MTILLGATFALLLAAVVLSFSGMKEGMENVAPGERARLLEQIEQVKIEQRRLSTQRELAQLQSNPGPGQPADPSQMEAMKAQLKAIEAEKDALEAEKDLAEKKAETFRDEAGLIGQRELERGDDELRRARMIRDALLIGRVTEYVNNPDLGGFATIEIVLPDLVQEGTVLAIRRNTGILGKVKVTSISAEGAIASPQPGFGPVEPQAGDDLIIPPRF